MTNDLPRSRRFTAGGWEFRWKVNANNNDLIVSRYRDSYSPALIGKIPVMCKVFKCPKPGCRDVGAWGINIASLDERRARSRSYRRHMLSESMVQVSPTMVKLRLSGKPIQSVANNIGAFMRFDVWLSLLHHFVCYPCIPSLFVFPFSLANL